MKKLFNIALTLCAATILGTSCGINSGEDTVMLQGFGSIMENYAGASTPYYILFDDGKTAFVTNTNQWTPTFKNGISELRYLLNYEVVNENAVGFDYEIKIMGGKECMPTQYYLPTYTEDLQSYTGGARVDYCFISPATNFLTLSVTYNIATEYTTKPPKMKLVQNTPENSPYKDLYEDDNYFYVELYHDDTEYKGTYEYQTNLGCKLTMPNIQQIMNTYSGIKVLAVNHTTTRPQVYKFNFVTEEQPKVE